MLHASEFDINAVISSNVKGDWKADMSGASVEYKEDFSIQNRLPQLDKTSGQLALHEEWKFMAACAACGTER